MNLLSINENCVVIDQDQEPLMRILAKYGIDSVPCPARQARSMSGGFHCNTLDVKRKGGLESYFD
jgi:N-dimethylarginine dimethylaminohydrolase